ncbi:ferritin-1, chloroplastic-like [Olea europaea var. sylvestris]|uniref:Ferritin n=1 Tax=Olea europaea subsp. europaea TaxID=158383 RepID=A0A8S0TCF1_OLEEU|nr:ferritin-1, chloroplastic-like [Olea europaea var. sylvestris]CAA3002912.1 ferritin-3, chloroplastic-like [Olea europaea subsp. europaea]
MFLEATSAISLQGSNLGLLLNSASANSFSTPSSCNLSLLSRSSSFSSLALSRKRDNGFTGYALSETNSMPLTGVVFQPFEEVKKDDYIVPIVPQVSLARQRFSEESEAAINEQINVEYNVSYVYHSMYAYFDRDNIALKGLAKFFKDSSEEERDHAQKLMEYQNIRGGRVKLHSILNPPAEFEHVEKGDALYAMELALSLEKLTNEKLLNLHSVADSNNDPQMTYFIETEFLQEQVNFMLLFYLDFVYNLHNLHVFVAHGNRCVAMKPK